MTPDPAAAIFTALWAVVIAAFVLFVWALTKAFLDALADRRWERSPAALKLAALERLHRHHVYEEPDDLAEAVERAVSG